MVVIIISLLRKYCMSSISFLVICYRGRLVVRNLQHQKRATRESTLEQRHLQASDKILSSLFVYTLYRLEMLSKLVVIRRADGTLKFRSMLT